MDPAQCPQIDGTGTKNWVCNLYFSSHQDGFLGDPPADTLSSGLQVFRSSGLQVFRSSGLPLFPSVFFPGFLTFSSLLAPFFPPCSFSTLLPWCSSGFFCGSFAVLLRFFCGSFAVSLRFLCGFFAVLLGGPALAALCSAPYFASVTTTTKILFDRYKDIFICLLSIFYDESGS